MAITLDECHQQKYIGVRNIFEKIEKCSNLITAYLLTKGSCVPHVAAHGEA